MGPCWILCYARPLRVSELAGFDLGSTRPADERVVRVLGKADVEGLVPRRPTMRSAARSAMAPATSDDRRPSTSPAVFVQSEGQAAGRRERSQKRVAYWSERQGLDQRVSIPPSNSGISFVFTHSGILPVTCVRYRNLLGHANLSTTQIYTHLDFPAPGRGLTTRPIREREALALGAEKGKGKKENGKKELGARFLTNSSFSPSPLLPFFPFSRSPFPFSRL